MLFGRRGRAHYELENYDRFFSDNDQAIRLDAANHVAWHSRGFGHLLRGGSGSADRAKSDCTQALALRSNDGNALGCRALAELVLGNIASAVGDINTSNLQIGSLSATDHYQTGIIYEAAHDPRAAEELRVARAMANDSEWALIERRWGRFRKR